MFAAHIMRALLSLCEHAGDDDDIDGDDDDVDIDGDDDVDDIDGDDDDDDIDGDDDGGHNVSALVIVRARGRASALALFPPQQVL